LEFFEFIAYYICAILIIDGYRAPVEKGFYITLTGISLTIPLFLYSTVLHLESEGGHKDLFTFLMSLWMFATWIPLSIIFQSSLFSWITVITLYLSLGFSFVSSYICYFFGYGDEGVIIRSSIASISLLGIFFTLKIKNIGNVILKPFGTPVMCMGSICLLFALIIFTSYWTYYHNQNRFQKFMFRQLLFLAVIAIELYIGSVYNIDSVRNTAITFLVIWMMQKYCEIHNELHWNLWFIILLFSIIIWRLSLYLNSNPAFVVSMFTMDF